MTTVPCPYCNRPVEATFDHADPLARELFGEHCPTCFLPFDIDAEGPVGQDGGRPEERTP